MSLTRLDKLLVDKKLVDSRQKAQAMIMAGQVYVNGQKADKAGKQVAKDAELEIRGPALPYVSRGGLKLESALDALSLDVSGFVCLDVGQSTGGFSDCLLQRGASRIYGVDVGYGQLALKVRDDPRVIVFERTNFRHFDPENLPEKVDLVVIDVSFISLRLILPVAVECMKPGALLLPMIKPQFEVGKDLVGSGGVVRDLELQLQAVSSIRQFALEELGLEVGEESPSGTKGPKGNQEFFCLMRQKA